MFRVALFGDSYAAPYDEYHYDFKYSWPTELKKIVELDNYAKLGCGPNTMFNSILTLINDKKPEVLKETKLIVFLPEMQRFNFSFFKDIKDEVFCQMHEDVSDNFLEVFFQRYNEEQRNFLIQFRKEYLVRLKNRRLEEMKNLGLLDAMAHKFKKVLVWRTELPIDIDYTVFKNIEFSPVDMVSISEIYEKTDNLFDKDYRINHISIDNHKIMFEELTNWILHDKKIKDRFKRLIPVDDNLITRYR